LKGARETKFRFAEVEAKILDLEQTREKKNSLRRYKRKNLHFEGRRGKIVLVSKRSKKKF
jgi:hypothetical protein